PPRRSSDLNGGGAYVLPVRIETGSDDLTDEKGMGSQIVRLSNLTLEPGDGVFENRRPCQPFTDLAAIEGHVLFGRRFGELHEDPSVLRRPEVYREYPRLGDQPVGDRLVVDADSHQHRLHRQLSDPRGRHAVPGVAGPRAHERQGVGDPPGDLIDDLGARFGHNFSIPRRHRLSLTLTWVAT